METLLYVIALGVALNLITNIIWKYLGNTNKHVDVWVSVISVLMCAMLVIAESDSSKVNIDQQQDPTIAVEMSSTEQSSIATKEERRIAIVIGNSKYSHAALKNPSNDASDMEKRLTDFGFEVTLALDVNYSQMTAAIDTFIAKLGPGTVGLFYYAGHGIQVDGENYLIPVDYIPKDEGNIKWSSYSASQLNDRMEKARTRLNIIILDACRNNPFRSDRPRGQGVGGLAFMNAGEGTFIAFATGPHKTADENSNERNGLFTKHLLLALEKPPLCLNEVFDKVRTEVALESEKKQIPWAATNVIGGFCFKLFNQDKVQDKSPECKGKLLSNAKSFPVDTNYAPSGIMGDIGDVIIIPTTDKSFIFEYNPKGQGPHEWDYKYVDDQLNREPARFGGGYYLDPPNNFGTVCGGYDLREFRRAIKWEARSYDGEVNVEFIIGGVEWVWDVKNKTKIKPPFSDSMRRISLGTRKLTTKWQSFEFDLSGIPVSNFIRVVNGFAWVISWSANDVRFNKDRTGPEQSKMFKIEIRDIKYER